MSSREIRSILAQWEREDRMDSADSHEPNRYSERSNFKPFSFDPNTVSPEKLKQFGWPAYAIKRFEKFRNSGFVFRSANDLRRIYGLPDSIFKKTKPYVILTGKEKNTYPIKTPNPTDIHVNSMQTRKKTLVEINGADSLALLTVRGIGPVMSSRIIRYRKALGGFYSLFQLGEIYGMDSARLVIILPQLSVDNRLLSRISVNSAGFQTLNEHPYINRNEASAIISYRKQHGLFKGPEDLKKILILSPEFLTKTTPYFVY